MPPKIRELKASLRKAGFVEEPDRGKGSHSWWLHPSLSTIRVNLSGRDGADAKPYQERDVREAISKVRQES